MEKPDPNWQIEVASVRGGYPVREGLGVCETLPELLAVLEPSSLAILADERVWGLHGASLQDSLRPAGIPTVLLELPSGEEAKQLAELERVLERFAGLGLDRDAFVLAFGGGASCDVAGLAAALWMRGVAWGLVPTSLLSQVDASVGGKTAINLSAGKNLVGAFHAPRFVLIDPSFLSTLPAEETRSGLAEVVKAALIGDALLFEHLEGVDSWTARTPESWRPIVHSSIRVKAEVVAKDEFEAGLRRVLNLGHTLGHGLEQAAKGALRHGEAVAVGLVAACEFARSRGMLGAEDAGRVKRLLEKIGLPCAPPRGLDPSEVLRAMALDKKCLRGRLTYVLPHGIGAVRIVDDVREDELADFLREV